MLCLKIAGWVANSVDPDETLHSALFAQALCPNTYGKLFYGISKTRKYGYFSQFSPLKKQHFVGSH